jgi:hypothetical protein
MGYPVEILNDYDVTLAVEIRTGNNPNDFAQNALFYEGDLMAWDSKTTNNFDPIVCYRRSADTDNPGGDSAGGTPSLQMTRIHRSLSSSP